MHISELVRKVPSFKLKLGTDMNNLPNIITDLILETIYSKLGQNFESKKDYTFSDHVKGLRKKWRDQIYGKFNMEQSWWNNILYP